MVYEPGAPIFPGCFSKTVDHEAAATSRGGWLEVRKAVDDYEDSLLLSSPFLAREDQQRRICLYGILSGSEIHAFLACLALLSSLETSRLCGLRDDELGTLDRRFMLPMSMDG